MNDILSGVRQVVARHKSLTDECAAELRTFLAKRKAELLMDEAIAECIAEGRANPADPKVCPLNRWRPLPDRDVPQKWRDEAIEHLAVRPDAQS